MGVYGKNSSGNKTYYKEGDYNVICQISGFKLKRSDTRRDWRGLLINTLFGDWNPRHPQDFIPASFDKQHVNDPNPESADIEVEPNTITKDDL